MSNPEYEVVWNGGELLPPRDSKPDIYSVGLGLDCGDIGLIRQAVTRLHENQQGAGSWRQQDGRSWRPAHLYRTPLNQLKKG